MSTTTTPTALTTGTTAAQLTTGTTDAVSQLIQAASVPLSSTDKRKKRKVVDGSDDIEVKKKVVRVKASDWQQKIQQKEMDLQQITKELIHERSRVEKLEQQVSKLEHLLEKERADNLRFRDKVHDEKEKLVEGYTFHMAKAHHSAMQTIQTSQHTIASALGNSITRLKHKGEEMAKLMPPLPDMKKPESGRLYHDQVSAFLRQSVTNMAEGETLLKTLDSVIADSHQAVEEERKRSGTLKPEESSELEKTIGEQQQRLDALRYQRGLLFSGLEVEKQKLRSTGTPGSAAPAAPTAAAPPSKPAPARVISTKSGKP